jgi:hypothetical protein
MRDVVADVSHSADYRLRRRLLTVRAALLHGTFSNRVAIGALDSHDWPLNHDYCDSLGRYAMAILSADIQDDPVRWRAAFV